MAQAARDQNYVTTLLAVSSVDGVTPVTVYADPVTHRILVDSASGSGDVSGPGSSTDDALVRWDGATGTHVSDSTVGLSDTGVLYPFTNDTAVLGDSTHMWSDLFLASGSVINFNNGDVTITHSANALTFAGGTINLGTATASTMAVSTSLSLEETGAGTDTITLQAPASIAASYTLTLPVDDGTNLQFLQTDGNGVLSWATAVAAVGGSNTQVQYNNNGALGGITNATTDGTTLTITSGRATTDFSPSSNDGAALGTTALQFADLFLASGGVINFNNGDVTITHASNQLITAGGSSGYVWDATIMTSPTTTTVLTNILFATATTGTPILQTIGNSRASTSHFIADFNSTDAHSGTLVFYKSGNATIGSATVVANNETLGEILFLGAQQTGTFTNMNFAAKIGSYVDGTVTDGAGADMPGRLVFSTTPDASGTPTDRVTIDSAGSMKPSTNDGTALGNTTNQWSDLFLAEGGVINWDNGDATLTQTGNVLAVAGADLRVATADVGTNADSVPTLSSTSTFTNKTLTSPTLTTPSAFTTGGTITLAENTSIALDPAGSADGKYTGITVTGVAGYTQAFGDLVYLDPTDSRWEAADANSASGADGDSRGMLAMVVSAGTDGNPCTLLLSGIIRADAKFPTFTVNNPIYVSETAGSVTQTQPTTTDVVIRIVGAALTTDEMYFNPDFNWITHT